MKRKVVFAGLLVLSIAANLMLAFRVVQLRAEHRVGREKLKTRMSPVRLLSTTGQVVDVNYREGETRAVFYFFSPDCPWCETNRAS